MSDTAWGHRLNIQTLLSFNLFKTFEERKKIYIIFYLYFSESNYAFPWLPKRRSIDFISIRLEADPSGSSPHTMDMYKYQNLK